MNNEILFTKTCEYANGMDYVEILNSTTTVREPTRSNISRHKQSMRIENLAKWQ